MATMNDPSPLMDRLPAGELLGIFRTLKGWTQKELARHLGVHKGMVSVWETGRRKPAPKMRLRLEKEFGIPADRW